MRRLIVVGGLALAAFGLVLAPEAASAAGGTSGRFRSRTPVSQVLPHGCRHPDNCVVSATAGLRTAGIRDSG